QIVQAAAFVQVWHLDRLLLSPCALLPYRLRSGNCRLVHSDSCLSDLPPCLSLAQIGSFPLKILLLCCFLFRHASVRRLALTSLLREKVDCKMFWIACCLFLSVVFRASSKIPPNPHEHNYNESFKNGKKFCLYRHRQACLAWPDERFLTFTTSMVRKELFIVGNKCFFKI